MRRLVEVHIETLVLHGFAPSGRYDIAAVVERELARLFAEHGTRPWLDQGGETAHLDGGTFELAPDTKAGVIGAQVAQAVYGGLNR